jgi:1,4-alpha-glucan branching enzyme
MIDHDGDHDGDHDRPDADLDVTAEEAAFCAAIARPLRAPERLDADFEARLLAAVRAGAAAPAAPAGGAAGRDDRTAHWWRRQHAVRVSPLAGLAAAAGFAAVVSAATLAATAAGRPADAPATTVATAPATATDTVHVVRFVLVEPSARRVALVGDFNGWAADSTPLMTAGAPGTWTISVTLPPGRHEYAFLVEEAGGEVRWMRDPFAPPVRDEYGTESSVVTVGGTVARRS